MLLQRYLTQPDRILRSIRFFYQRGLYNGRGVLTWNSDGGYHIEAPVERTGPIIGSVGLGSVGILREEDLRTIRMREQNSNGWIIAPQVIMRDRLDVMIQNRLSIPIGRIIISEPSHNISSARNLWHGSALYRLAGNVTMPDQVYQETRINDQDIGQSGLHTGIFFESGQGQRVLGRIVERQYLELYYRLPRDSWSKSEVWRWAEAAQDSLSICLGQSVALLQRRIDRNLGNYTEIKRQREIQDIRPFALFGSDQILQRDRFINLSNFLARNGNGSDVCRRIFIQLTEAARQRTWQGRALLVATILEAALRTLEGHSFQPGDRTFNVRDALDRFNDRYFSGSWSDACHQAYQTYVRIRHRNAHPDWLYEETGALSDNQRAEMLNDLLSLSSFYGYMILAIAGFTDLIPPP